MKKLIIPILFTTILLIECKEKEPVGICGTGLFSLNCEDEKMANMCGNLPLDIATVKADDEYEVIHAILNKLYEDKCMHILQYTRYEGIEEAEEFKKEFTMRNIEIELPILADYCKKNDKSYFWSDRLNRDNIKLIGKKELKCLKSLGPVEDSAPMWTNYKKKYKKSFGQLHFSRPGFNAKKNKAVVEYVWTSSPYDGSMWYIVILEKKNYSWKVTNHIENGAS